jgi:hypothetical protein
MTEEAGEEIARGCCKAMLERVIVEKPLAFRYDSTADEREGQLGTGPDEAKVEW